MPYSVVANAPTKGTKDSVAPENSKVVANQVFNHVTISDDRSAGSNLEVRNLLALEDKASQPASYRHHIVPVEEGSNDGQVLDVITGSQEDYYTDTDEDDEWDYIDETQHSDSASRLRITHHPTIPPPAPPLRSTGSGTNRYNLSIRNPWPRPRRSGPTLPNTLEGIDDYPGSGRRPPSPPLLAGARRVSSRTPPSRVGYRQSRYPPTHTATSDRRKNNPNARTPAKIQRVREVPVEYGLEDDIQETTQENVVEHSETRFSSGEPITVDLKSYLEDHDSSKLDLKQLKGYIDMLRDKAQQFEEIQQANLPTRHQIVYRIVTSTGREYDYLDHPEWVASGSPLCESRIPLENLELYLERNKDISFVVFRYFHQTQQRKDGYGSPLGRSRTPRHHWESICPVTEDLGEAVESVLKQSHEYSSMHSHYRMTQQIGAPYLFIYHNRERWESIVDQFDQPTQDQLNRLTDYVFEQFGRQYALADKLFSLGRISIDLIKFLFKPGDILVSCVGKEHLGYVAESWPEPDSHQHGHKPMRSERHRQNSNHMPRNPRDPSPDFSPDTDQDSDLSSEEDLEVIRQPSERKNENAATSVWTIEAWKWGFDGRFKRQQEELTLQFPLPNTSGSEQGLRMPNENQKRSKKKKPHTIQIEELNIYPIRFASETVVKKLQRRGQMFWKFRSGEACLVSYRDDENNYAENPSDERYMIDFKTFRTLHPSNTEYILKSTGNPQDELTPEQLSKEELPNEQFQYLLPLRIKGYNLRRKKWFDLESDRMFPVHWNGQAFETLVMDTKAKELIQALVSKQLAAEKATDIIAGKGNGLILLLHGGPGTGKTLTAESVAEVARKPLYRVTCGDVGTKAEDVEKYLESVLHLGKIWKCVVLLDEADVFLEQRSLEDLQRNALVSVFLRVLEYHEGILILTSNRVGTFDEAFKSRIQLALHYPSLGSYQRLRIWENFIQRLDSFDDGTVDINDLKRHLEELQKVEMNGRQIRNAITTARQYAEWKGEIMNYKYLKDVIEVSSRFDKYLDKLHDGHTFDELAENDGVR